MMDAIEDAQYRVVHDFPGGAVRLAPLVNMHPGTLSNKVHPGSPNHHLTVREAVAIQAATHDCRLLYAEAQVLGHACVALGDFSGISDVELLDAYAAYHQELGQTAAAIREALAHRVVTREQIREIEREIHEDVRHAFEFLSRLKGLCRE